MLNSGMFSSDRVDWATPNELFVGIDSIFHFTLDVCAEYWNAKVDTYFSPEVDGLSQSWEGNMCWMNPPYGREISKWAEKADSEFNNSHRKGDPLMSTTNIVALLPARTDTKWFHDYCAYYPIIFLKGRVRFERLGSNGVVSAPAPFPSMLVIMADSASYRYEDLYDISKEFGVLYYAKWQRLSVC